MLTTKNSKVYFNGVETQILGRSSFKFMAHLRHGNLDGAKNWIEHNQKLHINLLRVFGETEYWTDHPMFGSPPTLKGVWEYRALENGHRPEVVTELNGRMIRDLFRLSQETGMAFEYVVDATMKHAAPRDIPWGTIGHCVRQTLAYMRKCQEEFPGALVLVNFHNEWDAHSTGSWKRQYGEMTYDKLRAQALKELNMQASRARRWVQGDTTRVSFVSPGIGWEPEQWPEATIIVDHGGRNDFEYRAGTSANDFSMAVWHPRRDGDWESVCERISLRGDIPNYFSESKLWVDPEDKARAQEWYPNQTSYTTDLEKYEYFIHDALSRGIHFTIHDEKGMQTDSGWPRQMTRLEEMLGGNEPPPPPPPPDDLEKRVDALEATVDILTAEVGNLDIRVSKLEEGGIDPPPDNSKDYLVLERAKELAQDLVPRQQFMIWAGVRDPLYAASYCEDVLIEILKVDKDELVGFAEDGQELYDRGEVFIKTLPEENKLYQGRSVVKKADWKAFNEAYIDHTLTANTLRQRAQQDPIRQTCAYDSLKGWCNCRRT